MGWRLTPSPQVSEHQARLWQHEIERQTGVWLGARGGLVEAGVARRMRELGYQDGAAYLELLRQQGRYSPEWVQIIDKLGIQSTRFFRDRDVFACIQDWLQRRLTGGEPLADLMFWSAGCSTGEEAYSLAMLASELLAQNGRASYFGVLGSDINSLALDKARQGIYREHGLRDMDASRRDRFFSRLDGRHRQVKGELRKRVSFMVDNLLAVGNSLPARVDLVLCLNVLLYFRKPRLLAALDRLVDQLRPGGLLIIGQNEAIGWKDPRVCRLGNKQVNAYLKL